jgi:bifunctional non-homologous end joining protein LigD
MMSPLLPMLATAASPFDSGDYLFEVKWDGVRALAGIEKKRWRLWGRELADYDGRYPELEVLRRLPAGTIVDGELVAWQDQRPDLPALLRRHQLANPARIRHASRQSPVHYVLFDLLFLRGQSLLQETLRQRRSLLHEMLAKIDAPPLLFSEGVTPFGKAFFDHAVAKGQEGVMAKHQSSRYLPGQRSAAWKKIKPMRIVLLGRLRQRQRSTPVLACPHQAVWVEPELFCRVRFLQATPGGRLRGASFAGWLDQPIEPLACP